MWLVSDNWRVCDAFPRTWTKAGSGEIGDGLNAACVQEFSHAREARNKEEGAPPGFRLLRRRGGRKKGWQCLASLVRALSSIPFSTTTTTIALLQTLVQREGRRDARRASWRESTSMDAKDPLPLFPLLVIARSPPLSLTISRTPTPPPSYPLFLSFNLRLDCRLHILPLRPRSLSQLPFGLLSLLLLSLSSSSCYLMHTFSTVNFFLVISFLSFFSFLIQLFYSEIAEI